MKPNLLYQFMLMCNEAQCFFLLLIIILLKSIYQYQYQIIHFYHLIITLNSSNKMNYLDYNENQARLQKTSLMQSYKQKQSHVEVRETFGQILQRKLNHRKSSKNLKIIRHVKETFQIAIIKVRIITYKKYTKLYINFISHSPLYYSSNLQSKCLQYPQDLQTKSKILVLRVIMERETVGPRRIRRAQNRTQRELDDIHQIHQDASDSLQKNKESSENSSSSNSNFSIKDMKESSHLYSQCASIIYLKEILHPIKNLYKQSFSQLNLNHFKLENFRKIFFLIKGEQGFQFDNTLYLCSPCKIAINILNNILSNTVTQLKSQKTNPEQLKLEITYFLKKIQTTRQKFDCQSHNWQQFDNNMDEEKNLEVQIAQYNNDPQLKVQSKGQDGENKIPQPKS